MTLLSSIRTGSFSPLSSIEFQASTLAAHALSALIAFTLAASPLLPTSSSADSLPETITWEKIGDDIQHATVSISQAVVFSSELEFVRTSLTRFRAAVIRAEDFGSKRSTASALCRQSRARVCINANFFDEQGRPLGLVMSRGVIRQGLHRGGKTITGIFQIGRNNVSIVPRSGFTGESIIEALQAGPRILSEGTPIHGIRELSPSSRRAGVCIDDHKRLVLFAVKSGFFGITMEQIQNLLLHRDIRCVDALNLDGGSSAQLYVSSSLPGAPAGQPEISIPGRDEVPIVLGLFERES